MSGFSHQPLTKIERECNLSRAVTNVPRYTQKINILSTSKIF